MVRDRRWKYIHAEGFRPILFDLDSDRDELVDLGAAPAHESELQIFSWALDLLRRQSGPVVVSARMAGTEPAGILIGFWDGEHLK